MHRHTTFFTVKMLLKCRLSVLIEGVSLKYCINCLGSTAILALCTEILMGYCHQTTGSEPGWVKGGVDTHFVKMITQERASLGLSNTIQAASLNLRNFKLDVKVRGHIY